MFFIFAIIIIIIIIKKKNSLSESHPGQDLPMVYLKSGVLGA